MPLGVSSTRVVCIGKVGIRAERVSVGHGVYCFCATVFDDGVLEQLDWGVSAASVILGLLFAPPRLTPD